MNDHSRPYADLEIRILEGQYQRYRVEITLDRGIEFPAGELGPDLLPWVASASPAEDGQRVFASLLANDGLRQAWAQARGRCPQRRIRLRIDSDVPELHALPWELLRDPGYGGPAQDLAAATATPFSRYLAGQWPPGSLIQKRPIKILLAIANPQNLADYRLTPIDPEAERALMDKAVGGLDVELVRLREPWTLADLGAALRQGVHLLHLVAHGAFDQHAGAALYLADEENQVQPVGEAELAAMLSRQLADSTGEDRLQLAFLASCQTATRSPADAFRGLAPALVAAGVPAVLAMQDMVQVATAQAFARTFYERLLEHGLVDLACNEARSDLLSARLPGAGIPVLFMRLDDGRLFEPAGPDAAREIPHAYYEPETVYVPAGPFLMGSSPGADVPAYEMPQHTVSLPAFRIGRTPVTNGQYAEFLSANPSQKEPGTGDWWNRKPPQEKLEHPVAAVSWTEARDYCTWLGETGRRYRLPSEAEWEKAARGSDGRMYPWGDAWQEGACQVESTTTAAVNAHRQGASVHGCLDMLGNVQEWTRTRWGAERAQPEYGYPYRPDDGREDAGNLAAGEYIACRGGSYRDRAPDVRCSARAMAKPESRVPWRGFRVVQEL